MLSNMTKLQEKLDAIREAGAKSFPVEVQETMARNTQDLIDSGLAQKSFKKGDRLSPFSLEDSSGNLVSSGDFFQDGPLVLSFFRGFW